MKIPSDVLSPLILVTGYEIGEADTGRKRWTCWAALDLIIVLDLMLPESAVWKSASRSRERCLRFVIMLTAKGQDTDKILRLELEPMIIWSNHLTQLN